MGCTFVLPNQYGPQNLNFKRTAIIKAVAQGDLEWISAKAQHICHLH